MSKIAVSKKPKGKPGRKASGLRQVSPEAARLAVTVAALAAVRGEDGGAAYPRSEADVPFQVARAVSRLSADRQAIAKATGHVAPELEQMLHGDVQLVQMMAPDGDLGLTLQPVIRAMADPLKRRMEASGFSKTLIGVAMRFSADVARVTVGGRLVSGYGEGIGGAAPDHAIAQAIRMERLIRAQEHLTAKERAAVWALLVFELPLADIGWMTVGSRLGNARSDLNNAAILTIECALERMQRYYEAREDDA